MFSFFRYLSIFFSTEFELVEEIAIDVLQNLNRLYAGDLDQQITKLEHRFL